MLRARMLRSAIMQLTRAQKKNACVRTCIKTYRIGSAVHPGPGHQDEARDPQGGTDGRPPESSHLKPSIPSLGVQAGPNPFTL